VITILRELNVLKTIDRCCHHTSIYEIIYNLGTKWLVCNDCLDLEEFAQDIKEKRNLKLSQLSKQDSRTHIDDSERDRVERGEREK